ncbi:hypothetical protein L1049_025185 [Liquidambar formosana]|uniref:Uncharacterized protein n=1 Tax=Liquidambar formosana TaxID=63359 RepID=A0AAP0X5D4_LIQFO
MYYIIEAKLVKGDRNKVLWQRVRVALIIGKTQCPENYEQGGIPVPTECVHKFLLEVEIGGFYGTCNQAKKGKDKALLLDCTLILRKILNQSTYTV